MKSWITRFGMLAVLGSLVCGIMVAGCGSPAEEEAVDANNTTETAPDPAADPS